jgi:murein DD-endopeptidase MepM/ murein hydrolase activator NlpD
MTTETSIQRATQGLRTTIAIVLTGLLATLAAAVAPAGSAGEQHTATLGTLKVISTTIATKSRTWTYGWPVKPFDRQHPVRAFLNDPRIGHEGGASFHFGIDVSAPDGTPVYAVEGGKVFMDSARAIAVVAPNGHSFGYWHVVPAVRSHQIVRKHQLIGHIEKGWEHVHFAERSGGVYINPLRNGGLGPYADRTAPTVTSVSVLGLDLIATAYDTPDPVVPGDWTGLPVTPALIRWRVAGGHWQTVIDSRAMMRPRPDFPNVFTPKTRQNHKGKPGCFSYFLQRSWKSASPVRVEIAVSDTAGNGTVVSTLVSLEV